MVEDTLKMQQSELGAIKRVKIQIFFCSFFTIRAGQSLNWLLSFNGQPLQSHQCLNVKTCLLQKQG